MPSYYYVDLLLPLPVYGTFTYAVNRDTAAVLKPGMRVSVPFGKKKVYTALTVKVHDNKPPGYEVKEILAVLDPEPVVLESQLTLWKWISEYYMCPEGEVYKAALPARLDLLKKTRTKAPAEVDITGISVLNEYQIRALEKIKNQFEQSDVVLLHGVTSSGKTEIYIHLISEAIARGQQVLVPASRNCAHNPDHRQA